MLTEMKGIVMDFGPVRAVDNVDFTIAPGEITGLLGENGAGKTTLMNVLAGTFRPVKGEIFLDGEKVVINNYQQATRHGIRFIHQELSLCNDLRVFENMFLAEEKTFPVLLKKKDMIRECLSVFKRMGVDINPTELVYNLSTAQKQLVEIGRALLFKADLIIMDEPSTALSTREVEKLFALMRQLQAEGVSFIYISHKMPELFEICDTFNVMRDGQMVANGRFDEVNEEQITELMLGRQLVENDLTDKKSFARPEVALQVENLRSAYIRDVSFDVRSGEVLVITGLQGSGREEIADALFGESAAEGTVAVKGTLMRRHAKIRAHMKASIGLVPRNRKERGILNDLNIYDNLAMAAWNTNYRRPLISKKQEKERFARQKKALSIRAGNPKNAITSLSGGNQQKVILGRWLESDSDILLLDNPTQGIDVGAKFEIYQLIAQQAEAGKAILVFSTEFPEIYKVADRCIVMYKGEMNAELARADITEKNIMYYSTGANREVNKDEHQ